MAQLREALRVQLGEGLVGQTVGDGPEALLWIHGYTMDSTIWRELWERLPGWRHVGLDLPGHGASRPISPDDRLARLGEQVADAAVAVGARHLVALSFGTLVALQAAIERPSLFTSVVLAAPALAGGPQDPAVATRYIELARLYQRRGPGPHLRSLWMSSPPDIFRGAATRPVLWQQLCAIIDRHSWRELPGGQMIQLVNASHTRADLERVQAAVLVMIGEHELPAFRQSARLITSWLPNARAAAVPTAGHLCLIEEPAITARVIAEHISQSSN